MKSRDRFVFFIKYLTIEIYYPYIIINNINFGVKLNAMIMVYRRYKGMEHLMVWPFAFQVLGFGLGFAWKHCDNPIIENSAY